MALVILRRMQTLSHTATLTLPRRAVERERPAPPTRPASIRWIAGAMILGVVLGWAFPDANADAPFHASALQPLSTLFLRMIKSVSVPLVFGTLVVGIASHGDDLRRVGKLALRSLLYFEVVTTLAMIVGLVAVNVVQPGLGVSLAGAATMPVSARPTFASTVEHLVPQSVFEAAAGNDVLQIVFFAIVFGIALAQLRGGARTAMLSVCEGLSDVMFGFVAIVMKFAPVGVGAAIAVTVGQRGLGVLRHLGALVLTLYGALVVFTLLVLLPIALAFRVPIRRFVDATKDAWLIAFTTASSEAALPLALRNMEALGVPRRIVAFVLPAGYSFNMDGTALYLALASVFVAQAAGIQMPVSRQLGMMLVLMLTSKGLAAVPRASLVVLAATLSQFGLPVEGIAVILAVDTLMDMARTSINLVGNCLAAVVMARWDGSFAPPAGASRGRA